MRGIILAAAVLSLEGIALVHGNFHVGDYVQTSRRGQFHGQRTNWHDLQGRHCPRFNVDTTVALPIMKPKNYDEVDEYKIQLAFDHERLYTSWLTVLAKPNAPGSGFDLFHSHKLTQDVLIPYVHVQLWKREDEVVKVKVTSYRLPEKFIKERPGIAEEYKNSSQWPKHVLIQYHWVSLDEVDADRGMFVIIYGGIMMILTMIFGVMLTSREKVAEFFREMAAEGSQSVRPASAIGSKTE